MPAEFIPSNAGNQLVAQTFGIAEGFDSIFARAEALKQSRVKLEQEKTRFAQESAMAALNEQGKANELKSQNNALELQGKQLQATEIDLESKKRQQENDIAEQSAFEKSMTRLPELQSELDKLADNDLAGAMRLRVKINNQYGVFAQHAKYGFRTQEKLNPILGALDARIANASAIQEVETSQFAAQISSALALNDAASLAALLRDPNLAKAMAAPGEGGKALSTLVAKAAEKFQASAAEAQKAKIAADADAAKAGMTKPAPAELIQSTEKLLNSFEDLQKIKTTYDNDPELRGPFVGLIRDLNPWDADAKLLAGQIQAAVPTLARGVFGEVGVLTDQDIKNYKALLPNNRSPEGAAKALFEFLSDKLERAAASRKAVLEGNGYNTKGYNWPKESGSFDPASDVVTIRGIRGRRVKGQDGSDYLIAEDGKQYRINK